MPLDLIFMGPPGAGKGTQAARVAPLHGLAHIATGDMLREAVRDGTELGLVAKQIMARGDLVPDDVIIGMIRERLSAPDTEGGFILDGFPRTLEQVSILDGVLGRLGLELDKVLMLRAPEAEIVRRLSGRRTCKRCGTVFHLESRPPAVEDICDVCGSQLVQRPDDTEQVIRERMKVYADQTLPVADAYRAKGILIEVDGFGDVRDVRARLRSGLGRV